MNSNFRNENWIKQDQCELQKKTVQLLYTIHHLFRSNQIIFSLLESGIPVINIFQIISNFV